MDFNFITDAQRDEFHMLLGQESDEEMTDDEIAALATDIYMDVMNDPTLRTTAPAMAAAVGLMDPQAEQEIEAISERVDELEAVVAEFIASNMEVEELAGEDEGTKLMPMPMMAAVETY